MGRGDAVASFLAMSQCSHLRSSPEKYQCTNVYLYKILLLWVFTNTPSFWMVEIASIDNDKLFLHWTQFYLIYQYCRIVCMVLIKPIINDYSMLHSVVSIWFL